MRVARFCDLGVRIRPDARGTRGNGAVPDAPVPACQEKFDMSHCVTVTILISPRPKIV